MSFLQPWMLLALPVIALPIIIHLINQRRYQSVPWGAMMFLLAANRMSRGYARLRQWLILLLRTLAIAGLIFAISRPLASGWIGAAAGGAADVTIVLLDRSPSMSQRGQSTAVSKLETGRQQINDALQTLGAKRVVLIDSASPQPRELGQTESLALASDTGPDDATADIPGMLLEALDYIQENQVAQSDIWICSDLRSGDWQPADGRWQTIREAFAAFDNRVRFHLLAYPEVAADNRFARVTAVRRLETEEGAEVLVSLRIAQPVNGSLDAEQALPIEFELDGARSVFNATLQGNELELQDHRIPISSDLKQGWGKISIPGDANPADNDDYFVFSDPPPRRALVVSDDPAVVQPLELAAGIAPSDDQLVEAATRGAGELENIVWNDLMLIVWHGPLPSGEPLEALTAWVNRGGRILFVPPRQPTGDAAFGVQWGDWVDAGKELSPQSWRGDADLLANTQSGQSLPLGTLMVRRYVGVEGDYTTLASLPDDKPLLVRANTAAGGVYFLATTPQREDSSLAAEGVVLYVMIQRAGQAAANALRGTGSVLAGATDAETANQWTRVAGRSDALSTEQNSTAGIYQSQSNEKLTAVNRSPREDLAEVLSDEQLTALFQSLRLDRVNDTAGNLGSLVREIWRLFLIAMMISLLLEAMLCLPRVNAGGAMAA